jgi:hypothetical protein
MICQVPTAASMKTTAFWDVAPCSLVEVDRRFRGVYCLLFHGNGLIALKRRSTSARLHGVTSQKPVFFEVLIILKRHNVSKDGSSFMFT